MSDDTHTPEQQRALTEIGQKVVDLLDNEVDAKGLGDLRFVLDILVSVTGYYIAGIGDQPIRSDVFDKFGDELRRSIDVQVEAGGGAAIDILDMTKPN